MSPSKSGEGFWRGSGSKRGARRANLRRSQEKRGAVVVDRQLELAELAVQVAPGREGPYVVRRQLYRQSRLGGCVEVG